MSAVQRRFKKVIEQHGESITVGGQPATAVAVPISPSQARIYLPDSELGVTTSRPFLTVYVPEGSPGSPGDTLDIDGLAYAVQRVVDLRYRGETVMKILVAV